MLPTGITATMSQELTLFPGINKVIVGQMLQSPLVFIQNVFNGYRYFGSSLNISIHHTKTYAATYRSLVEVSDVTTRLCQSLNDQDQSEKSPSSFGSRPHTAKSAHTLPKVILSSEQITFSRERERMINLSEQTKFSRESMSVSALAVVEFPLAAAKIECPEEIHACENRIDVSSHV